MTKEISWRKLQIACNFKYGAPFISFPLRPANEIEVALRHQGLISEIEYIIRLDTDKEVAYIGHNPTQLVPEIVWYKKLIYRLIDWCIR